MLPALYPRLAERPPLLFAHPGAPTGGPLSADQSPVPSPGHHRPGGARGGQRTRRPGGAPGRALGRRHIPTQGRTGRQVSERSGR